jgi:xanthine dehydrogenase YagS FAD-binding subunit
MNRFEWVNPSSIEQAVAQLGAGAVVKAGGVDLMDLLKEHVVEPTRLVNLKTVRGLDHVTDGDGGLRVGPLVTLARLADHDAVRRRYRALADAAGHAATPQIRNAATIGGNLLQRPRCWYFRSEAFVCRKKGGDRCFAVAPTGENAYHAIFDNSICAAVHPSATATALVALGARLRIHGGGGPREVPLETFFVSPATDVRRENALAEGELVTEILLPAPARGASSAYIKQGEKESYDWPLAEVAVVLEEEAGTCKRASIVLGAAAPVPHRAKAAEAALTGRRIDDAAVQAAAHAAVQGATPLAQNAHKLQLFETIVRRTILAARGSAS